MDERGSMSANWQRISSLKLIVQAAAVFSLVLTVFILGCGGDEKAEQKPATTPTTTKTTAKSPSGNTTKVENAIDQAVVPTGQTPEDFKKSLTDRRVIVVNFYMTSPYDDSQVRSFVTTLETKYKGQVDFYNYLYTDGKRFGDLMDVLKVNTTPSVIIINRQAKVQRAWTGFVDSQSIEQGIVEALK